ncbi:lasso peptide biosynthesis B2 protein [Sphingomonas baiyangensis]|uniref:Lasso peptide biosynthesis B2 protein n=2 Tax=Sphingomonas baiyangensis TaxID=2572576 RepID=A0A4V5PYP3_9SPHN|nr:lasso peptide biosynthesis B2 protein [Sphingomonas baiyangensis]
MLLVRKWRSFAASPAELRLLVAFAFVLLALTRLAILILPFRIYAPLLGHHENLSQGDDSRVGPPVSAGDEARMLAVKHAVRRAARSTPWESVCLPQGLVAATLLRARGIGFTAYLGVARDGGGAMEAHCWVVSGTTIVTGAGALDRYTRVARFTHTPRTR